jgi:hypothetical protein
VVVVVRGWRWERARSLREGDRRWGGIMGREAGAKSGRDVDELWE